MFDIRIKSTIKKIKDIVKHKSVLDIGSTGLASIGTMSKGLINLASEYVGIDVNVNKELQQGRVTLLKQNAETFKLNKKFDVIACFEVLEHLENPGLFLDRAYSHLKDKGYLLISVPNIEHIYYRFAEESPYHLSCFNEAVLSKRLTLKGFKISSIKRINFGMTLLVIARKYS